MSLYRNNDKNDSSSPTNFQLINIINLIFEYFKKNPTAVLSAIYLLGFLPYVALHVENPLNLNFAGGVFIYLIYAALILWACLTTKRNHLAKIFMFLVLLAVLRFSEFASYALGVDDFWPNIASKIFYVTNSLGRLFFNWSDNSLFSILSAFSVLLIEIAAIIFILKTNFALKFENGANRPKIFTSNKFTWLLLGVALTTSAPVVLVKMNIIGYENQIKYLGVKTGHIKISAIGGISSWSCRVSIALDPVDDTLWDSVDVTISGRSFDDTEFFKETKNISLKEYNFVDFSKPQYNCEKLAKFKIISFTNFKGLNISAEEAVLRAKYITYSMDATHRDYTELDENLPKK